MTEQQEREALPPLPEPDREAEPAGYMPGCPILIEATPDYYTADQMHAYARAALAANVPAGLLARCRKAIAQMGSLLPNEVDNRNLLAAVDAALAAPPAPAPEADWTKPTTYRERFAQAVALLCGKSAPDNMIDGWLDRGADDHRLQDFAASHSPAWAQGIVLLDAAHVLAETPTEGVEHGEREAPAPEATPPQAQQADELLRDALRDAARSLETLWLNAGHKLDSYGEENYLRHFDQVRGYALSRFTSAREALAAHRTATKAEAKPLTDEQIDDLAEPFIYDLGGDHWYSGERGIHEGGGAQDFARAVERACAEAWGVKLVGIGASSGGAS